MRVRVFFVLLALAFALGLVACGPAAAESPAPPPGPTPLAAKSPRPSPTALKTTPSAPPSATPTAKAESSPIPTIAPLDTPTPALQEGPMFKVETVYTPKQADAEGLLPDPGAFYMQSVALEGLEVRATGTKPTPCHHTVAEVTVRNGRVEVRLYTRRASGVCIEVLEGVTAVLDLTPYLRDAAPGSYVVIVNGQKAGQVTVP